MQVDHTSKSSWEDESSAMPVAVGDILDGKYRIVRMLGRGGMGVVMAAVHIELGHRVALKFLLRSGAQNEETVARFAREAKAAAMIQNEHATRVLDIGKLVRGGPYMVLEMLDGSDLGALVTRRGPLSIEDAVTYVLEAIEAIAEAHSLGIVHRDLKPDNLFLAKRSDGTSVVKVLDFGISKFSPKLDDKMKMSPALTTTSAVIGSPMYMSPEQLRATRDADHRSDIWSIGVTLYELISGQIPFPWRSLAELSAAILKDPPVPLRARVRSVPQELDNAILRCLEKNPDDRFGNVAELANALAPFGRPSAWVSAERATQTLARTAMPRKAPYRKSDEISAQTTQKQVIGHFRAKATPPAIGISTTEQLRELAVSKRSRSPWLFRSALFTTAIFLVGGATVRFGSWFDQDTPVGLARHGIAKSIAALSVPVTNLMPAGPSLPGPEIAIPSPEPPQTKVGPTRKTRRLAPGSKAPAQAVSVPTTAPDPIPVVKPNPFADRE